MLASAWAAGAGADQSQGDPALDYALQCQGCHGAEGRGTEAAGVPRLRGSVGRFAGVEGGRAYLVQVPGVRQAPLEDAALAALLNWVLREMSAAELPEAFEPFTAAEIARYRAAPRIDVMARRAELLARIGAAAP